MCVVESDEVIRRLVAAATTFGPKWAEHEAFSVGHYHDAAEVARHVVALMGAHCLDEVGAVFAEVERLLSEEISPEARTLLAIGFLEDVQTIGMNTSGVGTSNFAPLLGPVMLTAWIEVHGFWGTDDD